MTKIFYDELVGIEQIFVEIEMLELVPDEKQKVKGLVDEIVHYEMVTFILDHLPHHHHEEFLKRLHKTPHSTEHLVFLESILTKNFTQKMKNRAEKLKKEIQTDLKKYKRKK